MIDDENHFFLHNQKYKNPHTQQWNHSEKYIINLLEKYISLILGVEDKFDG